jgi:hypothetical protein
MAAMSRFRFSLLALFGFVTIVAVFCAAFANPNRARRHSCPSGIRFELFECSVLDRMTRK